MSTGIETVEYDARRARLREALAEREIDAMLVTDLINVRYLTGFTGSNAALIVGGSEDIITTDGRYTTQVAQQVPNLRAEITRTVATTLVELASEVGVTNLGVEAHVMTVATHRALKQMESRPRLAKTTGIVEALREVKSESEVELIRQACAAADRALAALIARGSLRPGRTEKQVARELEWEMFEQGAEALAFETIAAAGANSAIPHHRPTDAVLQSGDFLKLDFGAVVRGYHSDMTRTFVLGAAADWQRDVYDEVFRSQAAGCAALAPGVELVSVDAASREIIDANGHEELFSHGLGHGVGLEIHEAPGIGKTSEGMLLADAVVTVEPGVYFAGRGGVRIEDTLAVREGGPDLLTLTSKELIEL